jgi:hypothetical protein
MPARPGEAALARAPPGRPAGAVVGAGQRAARERQAGVPDGPVQTHLAEGKPIRMPADCCPPSAGRPLLSEPSPALAVLNDALRYT